MDKKQKQRNIYSYNPKVHQNKYWCHTCQLNFSSILSAGIDDIICMKCGNDFCELITETNKPEQFQPYQKMPKSKFKRMPKLTRNMVLMALSQLGDDQNATEVREICSQDTKHLKILVDKPAEECIICQQEIEINCEALQCPCMHILHTQCLSEWLKYKNSCPKCRKPILSQPNK